MLKSSKPKNRRAWKKITGSYKKMSVQHRGCGRADSELEEVDAL